MILVRIIKKDSRFIFLSFLLLMTSILGGYIFFQNNHYHFSQLSNDSFNNLVIHNGEMLILTFFLSFISIGYLAWIEIALNSFLFGMGIAVLVNKYGSLVSFILLIHSIFELPAMIISAFLGRATLIMIYSQLIEASSKLTVLLSKTVLFLKLIVIFSIFICKTPLK